MNEQTPCGSDLDEVEFWPEASVAVEAWMGFQDDRLGVTLSFPELDEPSLQAFQKGPISCSFLDSCGTVPVALWAVEFPHPLGLFEFSFNCHGLTARQAADLLWTGSVGKDGVLFMLYGENTLVDYGVMIPDPESVGRFTATVRRQLNTLYDAMEYNRHLGAHQSFTVQEIAQLGHSCTPGWNCNSTQNLRACFH